MFNFTERIGSSTQIHNTIKAHIDEEGDSYDKWYIGITKDVDARLFGDHKVAKKNAWWIYRKAINSDHARAAEKSLINLGCDGGDGGGDDETVFVYAYKKTPTTDP
ncbi:MAG TPA: hypothetical protein DCE42_19375 [Myxococcales bacterium]|nr:hypothetical protein [Deltaproteobacteria bacterium]MBU53492.1 hypothetical protein [Deltaproteobacteria bacterium]HAA56936.1 hypothetical protein [Myxococcales bacterium]|tara:strand:+ start:15572 stop:15889 length:318 start_codon:yes stop_codon:yes gene_type:complete